MTTLLYITSFVLAIAFFISLLYISFYRKKSAAVIFGLMSDITTLNNIHGDVQIIYNKTKDRKVRNYAHSFIDMENLREILAWYGSERPDQIILFIKDTKQFYGTTVS